MSLPTWNEFYSLCYGWHNVGVQNFFTHEQMKEWISKTKRERGLYIHLSEIISNRIVSGTLQFLLWFTLQSYCPWDESLDVSCPVADMKSLWRAKRTKGTCYLGLRRTSVTVVELDPVAGVCCSPLWEGKVWQQGGRRAVAGHGWRVWTTELKEEDSLQIEKNTWHWK